MNLDITVGALKEKLEKDDKFVFIDVREPHEYQEANLGARLMPLSTFQQDFEVLSDHKDDEIIIHCRSGARSGNAKAFLNANGYTNVRNVLGGILEWQAQFGDLRVSKA